MKIIKSDLVSINEWRGVTAFISHASVGQHCCNTDYLPYEVSCDKCGNQLVTYGLYLIIIDKQLVRVLSKYELDKFGDKARTETFNLHVRELINMKLDRPQRFQDIEPRIPPLSTLRPLTEPARLDDEKDDKAEDDDVAAMLELEESADQIVRSGWVAITAEINTALAAH